MINPNVVGVINIITGLSVLIEGFSCSLLSDYYNVLGLYADNAVADPEGHIHVHCIGHFAGAKIAVSGLNE